MNPPAPEVPLWPRRSTVVLIAACAGTPWTATGGSQPERVEHLGLDLAQRPVDAGGQHGVVGAAVPDRAGDQLGGERGVAPVEVELPQHGGSTRLV